MEQTDFDRLGGAKGLKQVVDTFIEKVFDDPIIGYLFHNVDKVRLKQREFEFASRHLGGNDPYSGRPLNEAHQKHNIRAGQFKRRLWILGNVLKERGIPNDLIGRWLEHDGKLEPLITQPGDCRG
jgi:hemoglobin